MPVTILNSTATRFLYERNDIATIMANWILYDVLGKVVLRETLQVGNDRYEMDVSGLPAGVYAYRGESIAGGKDNRAVTSLIALPDRPSLF